MSQGSHYYNGNTPVLNINEVPLQEWRHDEQFEARMAQIGRQLGAKKLGYRIVVLPPGKVAWPMHAHLVNEEMFFVIEGTGKLRLGEQTWPLVAGDVVAVPPGPHTAHQIINDKVNIMAGSPPGGDKSARTLSVCLPLAAAVDYWEGEY